MRIKENKALITNIFKDLAAGNSRALLAGMAENSKWTVTGSCAVSGVYLNRETFYTNVLSRVTKKLTARVRPTVVRVLCEGDWVVLEWRGESMGLSGLPYNNSYCWLLRIENGLIQEGVIYSDTALVNAILEVA